MFPTIHLNGTSASDLLDGIKDAVCAVNAAIDAIAKAAPNARDYYPQGPQAFAAADLEHRTRLARLHDIHAELEAIGIHIIEAM